MIYNLYQYIKNETGLSISVNGYDAVSTDSSLSLIANGGGDESRGLKVDNLVQIMSFASSRTESNRLIQIVFNLLKNRFGITLAEVTIDDVLHPSIIIAQILPLQIPGYMGTDDNGLHKWSVNFKVTTGGN